MRVCIIVQARMSSTRLPKKVLKMIMDKSLLEYQIERLKRSKLASDIIIATTINQADDEIEQFCNNYNIKCYRGSENDVLSRYYEAATYYNADAIVRITSDCPLIDPELIDEVIKLYQTSSADYVSNALEKTYPRGLDTEIFSYKVLKEAYMEAGEAFEREHVVPFIYRNPQRYELLNYSHSQNFSHYRWTVDTEEDLLLITKIIEEIYPKNPYFTFQNCLQLMENNLEWVNINAHIEQKKLGE